MPQEFDSSLIGGIWFQYHGCMQLHSGVHIWIFRTVQNEFHSLQWHILKFYFYESYFHRWNKNIINNSTVETAFIEIKFEDMTLNSIKFVLSYLNYPCVGSTLKFSMSLTPWFKVTNAGDWQFNWALAQIGPYSFWPFLGVSIGNFARILKFWQALYFKILS